VAAIGASFRRRIEPWNLSNYSAGFAALLAYITFP